MAQDGMHFVPREIARLGSPKRTPNSVLGGIVALGMSVESARTCIGGSVSCTDGKGLSTLEYNESTALLAWPTRDNRESL